MFLDTINLTGILITAIFIALLVFGLVALAYALFVFFKNRINQMLFRPEKMIIQR